MNSQTCVQGTKIIFIGIDDTIRIETPTGMVLSRDAVDSIRSLRSVNDALLVVHSDWLRVCGREFTWKFLLAAGFEASEFHPHWCLPVLHAELRNSSGLPYERLGQVINRYGSAHFKVPSWLHFHPEVTNFVILDDQGKDSVPRHQEWVRYPPGSLLFDANAAGADMRFGPPEPGDPAYRTRHLHWHVVDPRTGFSQNNIEAAQQILSTIYVAP